MFMSKIESWIDNGLKSRAVTRDLIGEFQFLLKEKWQSSLCLV